MTHSATSAPQATSHPTDDEILGLASGPAAGSANSNSPSRADVESASEEQGGEQSSSSPGEPGEFRAIFESNPQLRDAWRDSLAFHKIFPTVADAQAAVSHSADLAKLDALFFSQDPQSHAQLAQALRTLNPTAFENLSQAMQAVSKQIDRSRSSITSPTDSANESRSSEGFNAARTQSQTPFTTASEHAFLHETNATAVQGVIHSIQSQLDRLLPEGTPQNTRNRLTGEIYREIDAALQSNRAFSQQLRQAFHAGQLTPENQRAIVAMVVGRAKEALPGITKKVLSEWTAGVVNHAQSRQERQRQSARRVDLVGGHPGGDASRALMPKDIDYRRMSDSDILNL
jgi:hypothetical protein